MFKHDVKNISLEGITLKELWNNHIAKYPTPSNLSYLWGFGSLAGLCLGIQILSGVFLNMYYISHPDHAFFSIEYIMREVNFGWFIRYCHSNGASFFFFITYLHIGRAIYFRSYKSKPFLWYSGLLLFFAMMATAFLGYVLPWGQMSFWGAMVITKIFGSLPFIGENFELWLWGGSTVTGITLHRFLAFHYVLGFVLIGLVIMHLTLLHDSGSNRPLKVAFEVDNTTFYPVYVVKDVFVLTIMITFFVCIVCFYSNVFGHPDNYIIANSMVTPLHIVPEWYFLPFYAALRAIDNKILGIVYMLGIIVSLFLLPTIDMGKTRNPRSRPFFRFFFWIWVAAWLGLGYLGGQPLVYPYTIMHKPLLIIYFAFFFWIKFSNNLENCVYKNFSKNIIFFIPVDFLNFQIEGCLFLFILILIGFKIYKNKIPDAFFLFLIVLPIKILQPVASVQSKFLFNELLFMNSGTIFLKNFLILIFVGIIMTTALSNVEIIRTIDFLIIFISIFLTLCIGIQVNDFFLVYLIIEALAILQISLILVYSPELKTPELTIKYFQINLIASLFLLMGVSWLYLATLTTNFTEIFLIISLNLDFNWYLPISLIIFGFLIKIIAVPFHTWAIEIYSKLPVISLLLLLGPIKAVLFFILWKILFIAFLKLFILWKTFLYITGISSIILSSIVLIFCKKIKNFFIFSSINQTGITLLAFSTGSQNGIISAWSYLIGYLFFLSLSFFILIAIENQNIEINFIDGIKKQIPLDLTLSLCLCFWSLGGFPLSLGFLTKLFIGISLAGSGYLAGTIIFSITSAISLLAYISLIKKILLNWTCNDKFDYFILNIYISIFLISIGLFPELVFLIAKF